MVVFVVVITIIIIIIIVIFVVIVAVPFISDVPVENVEGGNYISSEFQMGQVYMGDDHDSEMDKVVLYRPVYVTVRSSRPPSVCRSSGGSRTNLLQVNVKGLFIWLPCLEPLVQSQA